MKALKAPRSWMKQIRVVLVGAGGNGGEAADALAQFHTALIALGHPAGIDLTIIDDGDVREPNIVRQRFWPGDIGSPKAICLANRYNLMMGFNWKGLPVRFEDAVEAKLLPHFTDLVITAVDTPSARRAVHDHFTGMHTSPPIWLDLGNNARNGQAVIGIPGHEGFPSVIELYPEVRDMADDTRKSCSTAEAIGVQDCLINRAISTAGMSLVWELLRHGHTTKNAVILDLASGRQLPRRFPQSEQDAA